MTLTDTLVQDYTYLDDCTLPNYYSLVWLCGIYLILNNASSILV